MSNSPDSKLLQLLKAREIKQWDLARAVGMHPSRMNRIVHGLAPPTMEQAFAIANELGVAFGELWGGP